MAEYYAEYDRRPRRRRTSLAMRLVDGIVTLLSLAAAAAMILTFLVPWIDPGRVWFLPLVGLAAPVTYVATVVLALWWVIRWRLLRASLMMALVVGGLFRLSLYYKPAIRRVYDNETFGRGTFKVMTYNVRSFYGERGENSAGGVLRLIAEQEPDIVCLQEFNARLAERSSEYAWLEETYQSTAFGRTQAPDSLYGAPLVILSKYRILRSGVALTPSASVWADVLMGRDTVRIFNNHLRSTAIKASDGDYIASHRFLSDSAGETRIRSMVTRLRDNSILRAAQVDSISAAIAASRPQRIVCGDFNDTPVSYVYHRMARGLNDAFRVCGSDYSHTFRGFWNMLSIDYVLSSPQFETLSYEVLPATWSDHLPVVVRLRRTQSNN